MISTFRLLWEYSELLYFNCETPKLLSAVARFESFDPSRELSTIVD